MDLNGFKSQFDKLDYLISNESISDIWSEDRVFAAVEVLKDFEGCDWLEMEASFGSKNKEWQLLCLDAMTLIDMQKIEVLLIKQLPDVTDEDVFDGFFDVIDTAIQNGDESELEVVKRVLGNSNHYIRRAEKIGDRFSSASLEFFSRFYS